MANTHKNILTLKEVQRAEADILEAASAYFDKNKLEYFLDSGTLLGAVRHKGFIPWDDDIDLAMPRPSYQRLIEIAKKNHVISFRGKKYIIESYETTGSKYPFIKITDSTIKIKSKSLLDKNLWIDLFPIDGAPENNREHSRLFQKGRKYKNFYHIKYTRISGILREKRSLPNRLAKIALKIPLRFVPTNSIRKKVDNLFRGYDYNGSYYCYSGWFCGSLELRYRKQLYEKKVMLDFEGAKYPAPAGYDEYLGTTYGNYMVIPPKGAYESHDTVAYRVND